MRESAHLLTPIWSTLTITLTSDHLVYLYWLLLKGRKVNTSDQSLQANTMLHAKPYHDILPFDYSHNAGQKQYFATSTDLCSVMFCVDTFLNLMTMCVASSKNEQKPALCPMWTYMWRLCCACRSVSCNVSIANPMPSDREKWTNQYKVQWGNGFECLKTSRPPTSAAYETHTQRERRREFKNLSQFPQRESAREILSGCV